MSTNAYVFLVYFTYLVSQTQTHFPFTYVIKDNSFTFNLKDNGI